MLKYKIIRFAAVGVAVLLYMTGCKKVQEGYISDNIFYLENPFYVQQGVTTTSSTIIGDGSTSPLHVKLLAVRDALGKNADSVLLKKDTILVYTGAVTYQDSTVAMLNAKLKDSAVAPFSVNSIGGRLQFTQATQYVDTGTYTIDVQVSNVKGQVTLQNACNIVITPQTTIDSIFYQAWTTSDAAGNFYSQSAGDMGLTITWDPNGAARIIYKWVDKNGTPFNPAAGEVIARTGRPTFRDWCPYYPEVKTDSTIEYQYPAGIPQMPAYSSTVISDGSGWSGGICYYQVSRTHTDIGQNANTVSTILYYLTKGTYTVTYRLNTIGRVP